MKVLVACEESQTVCKAFRARGHEAYSCDIQKPSGGHPEWHILGDALEALKGGEIVTMDGLVHDVGKWDLVIAHPPCTYLTVAGAANIPKHPERIEQGKQAAKFFMEFFNSNCERIAIENPSPMKMFGLPKYTQMVRPWMFGDVNNKPICLWLRGLPELNATKYVQHQGEMVRWVHKATGKKKSCSKWYNTQTNEHQKHRSVTFSDFAEAMAEQWGNHLDERQMTIFDYIEDNT